MTTNIRPASTVPHFYIPPDIDSHRNASGSESERAKHFSALTNVIKEIENIPAEAHRNLRVVFDNLAAKVPSDRGRPAEYNSLVNNFQHEVRHGCLSGISLPLNASMKASFGERVRVALSHIGNRLIGREWRTEHLKLNISTFQRAVQERRAVLMSWDGDGAGRVKKLNREIALKDPHLLKDLNLRGSSMHEIDLSDISLRGKNLSHCSLPQDLRGVDLRETVLYGASFGKPSRLQEHAYQQRLSAHINMCEEDFEIKNGKCHPDFTGVQLTDAQLSLPSPLPGDRPASDHDLDWGYNHLDNPGTGSILKSIHSIEDVGLKLDLMEKCLGDLIAKTDQKARAKLYAPLADVLFNRTYAYSYPGSKTHAVITEIVNHAFEKRVDLKSLVGRCGAIDVDVLLSKSIEHALSDSSPVFRDPKRLPEIAVSWCQQLMEVSMQRDPDNVDPLVEQLQSKFYDLKYSDQFGGGHNSISIYNSDDEFIGSPYGVIETRSPNWVDAKHHS